MSEVGAKRKSRIVGLDGTAKAGSGSLARFLMRRFRSMRGSNGGKSPPARTGSGSVPGMAEHVTESKSDSVAIKRLDSVRFGTHALHKALEALWDELPEPSSPRELAVRGFANIVRQHSKAQWVLVQGELDLSAAALVRPTFEALVRIIWTSRGADDAWIAGFFASSKDVLEGDAETRKGPDVAAMLATIERHHPAEIYRSLLGLKEATWRGMHSYVHGGIRPVVQSFAPFPAKEAASLLMNANGMLILATNAVRSAHGLPSPMLAVLQQQYADCLPIPHL